ncbi:MAG: hypothetical protein KatS3mg105_3216 [Gemmatales bacterium]|nr:MAG: hypothetical protein KatS3mg105_3216 [Gemmatales bacterium]
MLSRCIRLLLTVVCLWTGCQSSEDETADAIESRSIVQKSTDLAREWEKQWLAGVEAFEKSDYGTAEKCFQKALDIARRLPPNDPQFRLTTSLNNLGRVYSEQKRFAEAERLYREALAILEQKRQSDPDIEHNLAMTFLAQSRIDEAEQSFLRALKLYTKEPKASQQMGRCLFALGQIKLRKGDFEAAERHLNLAIKSFEHSHPHHLELLPVLAAYAECLKRLDRGAEAEKALKRMATIREKTRQH